MLTPINHVLLNAVKNNNITLARTLLAQGADANTKDDEGQYCLHWATYHQNEELMILLWEYGANIDVQDAQGQTCLHRVVEDQDIAIINLLLKNDAVINIKNNQGYSAFDVVFRNSSGELDFTSPSLGEDIAEILINNGADVNFRHNGAPFLSDLICNGYWDLAALVIEQGADVNAIELAGTGTREGMTALHRLAKGASDVDEAIVAIARQLIEAGAELNSQDEKGKTPLHYAVASEAINLISVLLAAGAATDKLDQYDRTVLAIANESIAQLIRNSRYNNLSNHHLSPVAPVKLIIKKPLTHQSTQSNILSQFPKLRISSPVTQRSVQYRQQPQVPQKNEAKAKKRTHRKTTTYEQNKSNGLKLGGLQPLMIPPQEPTIDLRFDNEAIMDHAHRRVDLFFHLLILVYDRKISINLVDTVLQHGRGSNDDKTQACHSAILHSFDFFGYFLLDYENYFVNALGATVRLHKLVNNFDRGMEDSCRPAALDIVRQVSQGNLTPIDGLQQFLWILEDYFNRYVPKADIDNDIHYWQKVGTFKSTCEDDGSPKILWLEYIHKTLKLTDEQRQRITLSEQVKNSIYHNQYEVLRNEMNENTVRKNIIRPAENMLMPSIDTTKQINTNQLTTNSLPKAKPIIKLRLPKVSAYPGLFNPPPLPNQRPTRILTGTFDT